MDRRTDGWTDGRMDRWTDGRTDEETDRKSPHSTGLCTLSGQLPCCSPTLTQTLYKRGKGTADHMPIGAWFVACTRLSHTVGRSVRRSVGSNENKSNQYKKAVLALEASIMLLPLPKSTRLMLPCIRPCLQICYDLSIL